MNSWLDDEVARNYMSGIRLSFPYTEEQMQVVYHLIDNANLPDVNFIDLGAGDGLITAFILSKFPKAKCILVDLSENMMEEAKKKLQIYGNRVSYIISDFRDFKWADVLNVISPITMVFSSLAIHHLVNAEKIELYRNIFSVLGNGGLFLNIEHVKPASEWVKINNGSFFQKSVKAFYGKKNPGFSLEDAKSELSKHAHDSQNHLESMEKQLHWLKEIGFEDTDCYFKIFEICIFGGRKMT